MRLAHVGLWNFASHKDTQVDFSENDRLILIRGLNGSGKSYFMDGVSFAPYGKVMRSGVIMSPRSLVRDFQDIGSAEIVLLGDRELRIERRIGKKTANVHWWLDGVEGKGRTSMQKQPLIEKQLGFSYNSFMSASYLSQGRVGVFTDGKSADRIKILTNVLDLFSVDEATRTAKRQVTVLLDKAELIRGKIDFLEGELGNIGSADEIVAEIQYLKDQKRIEERSLSSLRKLRDRITLREEMERVYRDTIASLRSIVESKEQAIARLASEMARDTEERISVQKRLKDLKRAEKKVDSLKAILNEHPYPRKEVGDQVEDQARVMADVSVTNKQIEELDKIKKKGGKCPTCKRDVKAGHAEIDEIIKSLKAELKVLAKQKKELDGRNKELQSQVEQHQVVASKLESAKNQIQQKPFLSQQFDLFNSRISKKGLQKREDAAELSKATTDIQKTKRRYKKQMIKFDDLDVSLEVGDLNESIEEFVSKISRMAQTINQKQKNLSRSKEIKADLVIQKQKRKVASGSVFYYEYWADRFPKVKLGLIDTFIPQMEATSNAILSYFTPIRVEFPTSKEKKSGGLMDSFRIVVYKGKVVREWENWSGGEKKQVAIAICLAMNTALWNMGFGLDFILMDEVFADLDVEKRPKVLKYLVESGRNVMVISHTDINPAFFDRVMTVTMKNDISRVNG